MQIRQRIAMAVICLVATHAGAQSVVELPGVRATAQAGCAETATNGGSALSYRCLNDLVAPAATTRAAATGTGIAAQPPNAMGLYNASTLRNRMGTNLGRSVHPFRPVLTYPSPLMPAR